MSGNKYLSLNKPDYAQFVDHITLEEKLIPDVAILWVHCIELAIPVPGEGEVVIQAKLRPINPADISSLQGVYAGFTPAAYPAVPGLEGYGLIYKVGAGVELKPGQRVHFIGPGGRGEGSWAEYVLAKKDEVIPVPDVISDEVAAQLTINPVTIVGFLRTLNVPKGEFILQSGASSTLGRMLIQAAKHYGIRTINVVRRKELEPELKALGADYVIDSTTEDVVARVKEITGGKGAYGAVDPVAGDITGQLVSSVRNGGSVLVYGAMQAFESNKVQVQDILFRGVVLRGFWLSAWLPSLSPEQTGDAFGTAIELLAKCIIKPYVGKRYPLSQYKEALAEATKAAREGKVFLESA